MSRILGVDPGDSRIGVALSDPSRSLARPLAVIHHVSRPLDAAHIVELATQNEVGLIVIGQSYGEDGEPSFQGRKSARLGEAIQALSEIPIVYWDESFSTQMAQQSRRISGANRKRRAGHLDDAAAALILQSYLDAQDHFLDRET